MICKGCGSAVEPEEAREHGGAAYCEDCYLDTQSQVKTCDPWAVHLAKSDKSRTGVQLTPRQQKFYDLVMSRGEIPIPQAAQAMNLSEEDLRREFATLRHLELLRGTRKDGQILLVPF
ncbi:MAG: hypothetical protein FJ128_10965 [Deltaproteobacteria bacterium]|nr:hypothetical protein [Deltaproteobacteria bacterium]